MRGVHDGSKCVDQLMSRIESSSQAASLTFTALRIIKGVRQTLRSLDLEPDVIVQYADMCNVSVSPCDLGYPRQSVSANGKVPVYFHHAYVALLCDSVH